MLTDAKIRSAKPTEKSYRLPDTGGLFVFVTTAGRKIWRLRYKIHGVEKTYVLGDYPDLSLSEARLERDRLKGLVREGRNLTLEKKAIKVAKIKSDSHTFEQIARQWHKFRTPLWTEHHAHDVIHSLERDVFPMLGSFPIADINAPMILAALREIEKRGAIETAHRVRQRISEVFVFAIGSALVSFDPAAQIKTALLPIVKGRQPALTSLEDLKELLVHLDEEPGHPVTLLALRLLVLTVVRPGELRAARWEEFDLEAKNGPVWHIPAERMKMKREHDVPLSVQAIDVLNVLKAFTGTKALLFPNIRRPAQPMSENAMGYLLNRAGFHKVQVPHGFRASFSSIMNERFPVDRQVIDLMLAHAPNNKVEGAYNRAQHMERRKELYQLWADMVMDGLKPAQELVSGKKKRR